MSKRFSVEICFNSGNRLNDEFVSHKDPLNFRSRKHRGVGTAKEAGNVEQHNGSRTESRTSEKADAVRWTL